MPTDAITQAHSHTTHCWWNPDEARWVCRTVAPASESADQPLVDVRDMIVVHTALLREFRLAPAAVLRTADGDRKQTKRVAGHITLLCDLLHHHHEGEDELLWPKLRERTPLAASVVDAVEAQHAALDTAITSVRDSVHAWASDADSPHGEQLAAGLETLYVLLREHLDLEERALLPLAASALTEQEWTAVGEAAVATMPKPTVALVFGMFCYEGDPEVLRTMLASAPSVPRTVLPIIAPRIYARRARAVHGTARP